MGDEFDPRIARHTTARLLNYIRQPDLRDHQTCLCEINGENQMSLAYLKVKIKSLAAEARIIRHDEEVWRHREHDKGRPTFFGLRSHRTWDVRNEARAAQLAYAFLRGKSYAVTEPTGKDNGGRQSNPIDWQRVTKIAAKYGPDRSLEWAAVKEWVVPNT